MARKSCGLVREHLVCRTKSGSILTTSGDCSSAAPLLPRNSPILGRNGQSPKKGFLVSNSRVCSRNGNIHSPHNRGYTSLTPHLPPPHSARFSRHEERETPAQRIEFHYNLPIVPPILAAFLAILRFPAYSPNPAE